MTYVRLLHRWRHPRLVPPTRWESSLQAPDGDQSVDRIKRETTGPTNTPPRGSPSEGEPRGESKVGKVSRRWAQTKSGDSEVSAKMRAMQIFLVIASFHI
jgi:hypothetical protein